MARRDYSEQDKERGLQALDLWQGNRERAAEILEQAGYPIPPSTLRDWKNREPERYADARRAVQEKVWAETGEEWQALQRQNIAAASEFVSKSVELLRDGNLNDASKAARAAQSLGVTGGISADKTGVAQQRPVEHKETRDLQSILRILDEKFKGVVTINPELIESTAEEIPMDEGDEGA